MMEIFEAAVIAIVLFGAFTALLVLFARDDQQSKTKPYENGGFREAA